jgi:hypothetical protein
MKQNINLLDIKEIVGNLKNQVKNLYNKKILLLGSGGFLGKYFIETFNEILNSTKNIFNVYCLIILSPQLLKKKI